MVAIFPPVICLLLAALFYGTIATGGAGGTDQTAPNAAAGDGKGPTTAKPLQTADAMFLTPADLKNADNMIKLMPSDGGEPLKINIRAALLSKQLNAMINDLGLYEVEDPDDPILDTVHPIPNVKKATLQNVIKWCNDHDDIAKKEEQIKTLVKYEESDVDQLKKDVEAKKQELWSWLMGLANEEKKIFAMPNYKQYTDAAHPFWDLILAANYLEVSAMQTQVSNAFIELLKNMPANNVRKLLNIKDDEAGDGKGKACAASSSSNQRRADEWRFELDEDDKQAMAGPSTTASDQA